MSDAVHKTTITKHTALREWHVWNRVLFDDSLIIVPKFIIKRVLDEGSTEGYFQEDDIEDDECIITISHGAASNNYIQFSIILIHEMIHQLQWEKTLDVDHDKYFERWCKKVQKKINLDVR